MLYYVTVRDTRTVMKKILETYTVEEVAKALRLHEYTIRRLCRDGKIPAFKVGGQWRFGKNEIDKFIKGKKRKLIIQDLTHLPPH